MDTFHSHTLIFLSMKGIFPFLDTASLWKLPAIAPELNQLRRIWDSLGRTINEFYEFKSSTFLKVTATTLCLHLLAHDSASG